MHGGYLLDRQGMAAVAVIYVTIWLAVAVIAWMIGEDDQ